MSRLMFCQTVNVLSCIMFKAVRKPFSKQITAGVGWIIPNTLFNFNIYVEIEKCDIQTGLPTILTEMLTVSGLWCDILDRNSPITPLVCRCFDRIPNTLLILSGQTHKLTDIMHLGAFPNLPRVFCIGVYNCVPLEFIKGTLREETPAFVYQPPELPVNPAYFDTVPRPPDIG